MAYKKRNEVAEELGVSPQAIGKRLKATGLISQCKKSGRQLMIPDEVFDQLRAHYDPGYNPETKETETTDETETTETKETNNETTETKETETTDETETTETKETNNETKSVPWEVYEDLRNQLSIKDEQIKALNMALLNAQGQGMAAQALHGADKKERLLTEATELKDEPKSEPKSRWQRLLDAWRG